MRHWRGPFDRQGYHHGNLKEALIEAAQRFIAERGLGGFTLADAAKLVGVTPAALYRHFRGREALVAEVAFRGFSQLAERLGRALQSNGTPLERFTRMGEAYLAFAEQEPGFYAAMFSPRPSDGEACGPPWAKGSPGKPPEGEKTSGNAFDFLVQALSETRTNWAAIAARLKASPKNISLASLESAEFHPHVNVVSINIGTLRCLTLLLPPGIRARMRAPGIPALAAAAGARRAAEWRSSASSWASSSSGRSRWPIWCGK
jgi:AcrR family transcriptional regulator